jgi:hypothetical protein
MIPVAIAAIVVVIIPIAITVPTVALDIPPSVGVSPAVLPSLAQFDSSTLRFPAFVAMMFDSLVQTVIGAHNAFLTLIIGLHGSCTHKKS